MDGWTGTVVYMLSAGVGAQPRRPLSLPALLFFFCWCSSSASFCSCSSTLRRSSTEQQQHNNNNIQSVSQRHRSSGPADRQHGRRALPTWQQLVVALLCHAEALALDLLDAQLPLVRVGALRDLRGPVAGGAREEVAQVLAHLRRAVRVVQVQLLLERLHLGADRAPVVRVLLRRFLRGLLRCLLLLALAAVLFAQHLHHALDRVGLARGFCRCLCLARATRDRVVVAVAVVVVAVVVVVVVVVAVVVTVGRLLRLAHLALPHLLGHRAGQQQLPFVQALEVERPAVVQRDLTVAVLHDATVDVQRAAADDQRRVDARTRRRRRLVFLLLLLQLRLRLLGVHRCCRGAATTRQHRLLRLGLVVLLRLLLFLVELELHTHTRSRHRRGRLLLLVVVVLVVDVHQVPGFVHVPKLVLQHLFKVVIVVVVVTPVVTPIVVTPVVVVAVVAATVATGRDLLLLAAALAVSRLLLAAQLELKPAPAVHVVHKQVVEERALDRVAPLLLVKDAAKEDEALLVHGHGGAAARARRLALARKLLPRRVLLLEHRRHVERPQVCVHLPLGLLAHVLDLGVPAVDEDLVLRRVHCELAATARGRRELVRRVVHLAPLHVCKAEEEEVVEPLGLARGLVEAAKDHEEVAPHDHAVAAAGRRPALLLDRLPRVRLERMRRGGNLRSPRAPPSSLSPTANAAGTHSVVVELVGGRELAAKDVEVVAVDDRLVAAARRRRVGRRDELPVVHAGVEVPAEEVVKADVDVAVKVLAAEEQQLAAGQRREREVGARRWLRGRLHGHLRALGVFAQELLQDELNVLLLELLAIFLEPLLRLLGLLGLDALRLRELLLGLALALGAAAATATATALLLGHCARNRNGKAPLDWRRSRTENGCSKR
ncbi:hypothetical protein PybrP1_012015 [[Pythium] brassicae (nom. inval.)]|nr:hypothetical protein PybrP1_012015 [[Pythium] brassicae (nom. inval.)]